MDSKQTIVLFLFFAFALNIILCQDQVPAPYNFDVSSVTETSVTLEWVAPDSGLKYNITTTDRSGVKVYETITEEQTIVISGLKIYSRYTFTIRTVRGASFSRGISVKEATLPTPTNITAAQTEGKGVVTFTITFHEGRIYEYCKFLLELRKNDELVLQVMSNSNEINVSGLSDGTYTPTVMARRKNYKGQPFTGNNVTLTGVTAGADVSAPSGFSAEVDGNTFWLRWTTVNSGTGYQLTVGSGSVPYYVDGLKTYYFFANDLKLCTEYSLTIRTTSEGSKLSGETTLHSIKTGGPRVIAASVEQTVPPSGKVTVYWNPIELVESCHWEIDIVLQCLGSGSYRAVASQTESSYELYNIAKESYTLHVCTLVNGSLGPCANKGLKQKEFPAAKVPEDPTYLEVTDQSATTVSLSWTPANEVVGYQYTLDSQDQKFIIDGGSVSKTKIRGLTPSTNYTITVNSLTESSESKGLKIRATTKSLEQETK